MQESIAIIEDMDGNVYSILPDEFKFIESIDHEKIY